MGIDGLLRQLKDSVEPTHLRQFSGQKVAVDAFSWLHKAYVSSEANGDRQQRVLTESFTITHRCYGCAFELSTGRETDSYVRYMLRKVDLVRACGIKEVVLVFDGQRLPLKVGWSMLVELGCLHLRNNLLCCRRRRMRNASGTRRRTAGMRKRPCKRRGVLTATSDRTR